jgi:hypothetical protein
MCKEKMWFVTMVAACTLVVMGALVGGVAVLIILIRSIPQMASAWLQ